MAVNKKTGFSKKAAGPTAAETAAASAAKIQASKEARTADVKEGQAFGNEVLGPEGLGRLGTDAGIQETMGKFKDIADQGLSRGELAAERAQATRSIDSSTQTSQRSLQAQLARSGVKGAVAGQQQMGVAFQGMQQKADLSQNLFLKSEQIKRQGLENFSAKQGEVKSFDLGQAAKEKDIQLQSGLGFAQMGSAERTAQYAAEQSKVASIASAKASKPSCFIGDTKVELSDGSMIDFKDIEPGYMLKDNNFVFGISKHLATSPLYKYKGVKVTGDHFVLDGNQFKKVKDCRDSVKIEYNMDTIFVYNIITSSGIIEINNVIFSDWEDLSLEENYGNVQAIRQREIQ